MPNPIFESSAKQRVSKLLANAGVASRRKCEALIVNGRVRVNKALILEPGAVALPSDELFVDGCCVARPKAKVVLRFHKPKGCVCTSSGRDVRVLDYFAHVPRRLFTCGRLDKETTGLLLITDDGEFANRVMHPRFGVPREYLVKSSIDITAEHLQNLSKGALIDGVWICPLHVHKVRRGSVKITVGEGKNREIRRLMQAHQLPVLELARIRIGQLHLGNLPEGAWQELSNAERKAAMESSRQLLTRLPPNEKLSAENMT